MMLDACESVSKFLDSGLAGFVPLWLRRDGFGIKRVAKGVHMIF